jgi:CHAT domain-containing protein
LSFAWTLIFATTVAAADYEVLRKVDALTLEARKLAFQGKYLLGIARAREALKLGEETFGADDARIAAPVFALADLLRDTARHSEARLLYERLIKLFESSRGPGDPYVGVALSRLAGLLINIGDPKAAKPIAERAHSIVEATLHPSDERISQSLITLGRIALGSGDYEAAKSLFDRALKIRRSLRKFPPWLIARNFHLLGRAHMGLKDYDAARSFYQQALRVREQYLGSDHPELGLNLFQLGNLSRVTGDIAGARAFYERALAIARKSGAPELTLNTAVQLGRIHEQENRMADALPLYQEAVGTLNALASQFEEESERAQYLQADNRLRAYDALIRLLLKLHEQDSSRGYEREAWAVIEARKNRVVSEIIAASHPKLQDPDARREIEKANEAREQALALEKALLVEKARPHARQETDRIKNLTTLLAQTKSDYLKQVQAFLARYPQYRAQFVDQQTVDPKALAKFADRLPPGTLAIQFFPSPDALYLFVVAPGGYFKVKSQTLPQSELYKLIKEYRQYVERAAIRRLPWNDDGSDLYRRDIQPLKEVTLKLSTHLLGPIESELREYNNLVIVPNDLLLYLPIHALIRRLPDDSLRFLSETHVVSYLTQLELADLINPVSPTANASLLALANPDGSLPGASREIREIGKIRPAVTILDGPQATKQRFLTLAGKFPDLHLATHGVLDPERPEKSYLLMAGGDEESQRLSVAEIAGLRLSPNGMAILSACETAVGEQVPGAALITLSAAFSQAGSQSIMASLWKVDDAATRDLMVAFHASLSKAGRAAALQQAQLSVLKNPATAHPYYWAPFILIGAR